MATGTELEQVERRIAWVERIEDVASLGCGTVLAALYWLWFWRHGHIASYSCLIPFFIGGIVPRIGFAFWGARLDQQRRRLTHPEENPQLPEARVVVSTTERTPAAPLPIIETKAPEVIAPAGEKPRFLG